MSRWLTQDSPGGVHVLPLDDLIIHVQTEACPCAPRIEGIGYTCWDHGSAGVLAVRRQFVHAAMDGRE